MRVAGVPSGSGRHSQVVVAGSEGLRGLSDSLFCDTEVNLDYSLEVNLQRIHEVEGLSAVMIDEKTVIIRCWARSEIWG
jgi:hypothetical protein